MDATVGQSTERVTAIDPGRRSEALAAARQRASQAALKSADAAEARRADQREMVRGILERAVGANTRLSITRGDDVGAYVYRAIDVDSGEVVSEWPPEQFIQLLEDNGIAAGLAAEALAGLTVDEEA